MVRWASCANPNCHSAASIRIRAGESRNPQLVVAQDEFDMPNGLCLSADASTLYVDDASRGEVKAFTVAGDGSPIVGRSSPRGSADSMGFPDGMKCDDASDVWVLRPCWKPSVLILQVHPKTTNLNWGIRLAANCTSPPAVTLSSRHQSPGFVAQLSAIALTARQLTPFLVNLAAEGKSGSVRGVAQLPDGLYGGGVERSRRVTTTPSTVAASISTFSTPTPCRRHDAELRRGLHHALCHCGAARTRTGRGPGAGKLARRALLSG